MSSLLSVIFGSVNASFRRFQTSVRAKLSERSRLSGPYGQSHTLRWSETVPLLGMNSLRAIISSSRSSSESEDKSISGSNTPEDGAEDAAEDEISTTFPSIVFNLRFDSSSGLFLENNPADGKRISRSSSESDEKSNSGTIGPDDRPDDMDLLSPGLLGWILLN